MKLKVILTLCLIAISYCSKSSRVEKKRKSSKGKSQTKLFDWSINKENDYTIYIYTDSSDYKNYEKCQMKTSAVYPVSINSRPTTPKKEGILITCPNKLSTNFQYVATKTGNKNEYLLDYLNTSPFISDGNSSLLGFKGRHIHTSMIRSDTKKLVRVEIMFQVGVTGDYITKEDLIIMRESINSLRSDRQSKLRTQKTIAFDATSQIETISKTIQIYNNTDFTKYTEKINALNDGISELKIKNE